MQDWSGSPYLMNHGTNSLQTGGLRALFVFGCARSSLLCGKASLQLFSSCGEWGLLSSWGPLIAVTSLVAEHTLWGAWASVVVAPRP